MAKRKRKIALLLAICLFASFLGTLPRASAAEASLGIGTVDLGQSSKTTAAIHDKPDGTATHYLKDGTDVSILGIETGKKGELWYKVEYTPDVVGYIPSTNISTTVTPSTPSTTSPTGTVGTVNENVTNGLLVRSEPSKKHFKILESLFPGDKVTLIGTEKSEGILWDIVLTEKGEQGWCTSGYIDTNAPSSSPSNSELPGDDVYEMGIVVGRTPIYTYENGCMIPISAIFIGGEEVYLIKQVGCNGELFYEIDFGKLEKHYIPSLSVVRNSEKNFHGRPYIDTYKGTVNGLVHSCLLVRSAPSETDFEILDRLYCGNEVAVMDHTFIGGVKWYRLFRGNAPDGWVKAMYIALPSERVIHESVTGIGRISQRTTAHIYPGKQSAEDKTFLGGEKVHIFELITIGKVKQYACEFGGDTYYVDTSDVNFSVPRNAFLHTIN